jgi:glycerol kinase
MARYILCIDQGTTGTTVTLMNNNGRPKVKVNQEFRQIFPKPGWVEHNPNDIWKSVTSTIKKALAQAKVKGADIATIGITNQRETVMAWDRETGKAIGNAIVWQCRRTTDICNQLKKRGFEKQFQKSTGLVLDPYFSGTKMKWILENNTKAKSLARRGRLCFGTVDCFLIWKLSGGKSFATDVTNASRTLTMNLQKLQYDPELLRVLKLKKEMLPEILPSAGEFATTQDVAGLPNGVPITGVLGDQQSALFGQLCFKKGQAKITFGTGSFLLMNTGERKVASKKGLLTTVAWQLPGAKPVYALEGGAFICGAAVQWLRDNMGFFKSSSEIEGLAKKVPDCQGLQFIPAFAGLGAPYWNPDVRGTVVGITRGTRREHFARATLEAMALQNVDIVETMSKESKTSISDVRVDGGAAANNLLMQMQADFLGAKVIRPKIVETTSMGAGFVAGIGAGIWHSQSQLRGLDRVDRRFQAKYTATQKKQRVSEWRAAISALQQLY